MRIRIHKEVRAITGTTNITESLRISNLYRSYLIVERFFRTRLILN